MKNIWSLALGSIFITSLVGCQSESTLQGEWVEPIPGMSGQYQGFVLKNDGVASSINMATIQYEQWKQEGDLLLLSGKSIGNHQTIAFTDTLSINKITKDSLMLKKGSNTYTYSRANENHINNDHKLEEPVIKDKISKVKGILVIGDETRSFTTVGDSKSYWIVDKTGTLYQKYDEETKGIKNGKPVEVELEIKDLGPTTEGFGASYDGVYEVVKINRLNSKE